MALFEVFIPAREPGTPNVTLTIEAPNWIGALRSGLKSIGEGQEAIANVMCDIKEDNSIHVTDVATRRVFRLRELTKPQPKTDTGPRPISMPDAPAVDDSATLKNERPPDFNAAPRTLIEFPVPKLDPPAAAAVAAKAPDLDSSVPWTAMPAPTAPAKIPDPRRMVSPAAAEPSPLSRPTPVPTTLPDLKSPFSRATPAHGVPASTSQVTRPVTQPVLPTTSPATPIAKIELRNKSGEGDPDTLPVTPSAAASDTGLTERPRSTSSPSQAPLQMPTPRGVPAPAPKRPSGQFAAAPQPKSREITQPTPRDPKIGRTDAPKAKPTDVQDAIAEVFDATQDLYMQSALSPQHVADRLLDIALSHIPAESGTFYLADVNGHSLTFAAVRGPKADALKRSGMTVKVGQGIIGFCALEGVCLAVSDIQKDPRFLASIAAAIDYQPKDTLCASAEKDGRLWGAIQVINSKRGFEAAHMEVLRFIGLTAAAMLERIAERD